MRLLQCPPLFCCSSFLFDPQAIICHWWWMESKWLKKHIYECQLIFKWCSWSILIMIHVLNLVICDCCNALNCFAVPCSHLTQRPSFATGDLWSQTDWRSTCMSANLSLNGIAGLHFFIIHVLNLEICGCCNGHHCFAVPCSYSTHRPLFATGNESSQSDLKSTCMGTSSVSNSGTGLYWSKQLNKTTHWLEIINLYPNADFNDAWYPFMNQVHCAGSIPTG
jgi:hypothetical protein